MGLIRALTRLDAVVLPRLGRGARRINRYLRQGLRGPLTLIAAGLVMLVALVVITQSVGHSRAADQPDRSMRVGVAVGDWIPDYVAASRARLDNLLASQPGVPVYAFVSFKEYLTPDQVAELVRAGAATEASTGGQLSTISAKARVPIQYQTEIVDLSADRIPDDLTASMGIVAARKEAEAAGYTQRAATDPTGPWLTDAQVDIAEAQHYRDRCACIYGLVVRGVPAVLERVAALPGTRAVDPAPQVTDPSVVTFMPPLPEQHERAVSPPDGPTSTPVPPSAPTSSPAPSSVRPKPASPTRA
jgi:hypothetical protein